MDFDKYVEFLEEVVEDPNALPDSEDEIEEMILAVANDLDVEKFVMNVPVLILSLMLHQAALQGCMNLLNQGEDIGRVLSPTVH
jgi:hypothetical protein